MLQQLLMQFYIFWSMYINSLLLRDLQLLSFAAVIMYDQILTFILEVRTVTLQIISLRCLTLFVIIVLPSFFC